MKLCGDCQRKPWPYLIVVFVGGFSAFLTWLALNSAGVPPAANKWWSLSAFVVVSSLLLSYMISCMRRHCGHEGNASK